MYERFTDRSRNVMQLANQEAQRYKHEFIGTEHILLGLAKEDSGVAANVLKVFGVEPVRIIAQIERLLQEGPPGGRTDRLPQTPRAKNVIMYSMEEARVASTIMSERNISCSGCCVRRKGSLPKC